MRIKYSFDRSKFERISTKEDAYWFGFLLADGNIHQSCLQFDLLDAEAVYGFRDFLGSSHPVKVRERPNLRPVYCFRLSSVELTNNLIGLGCTQRKSQTLVWPDVVPLDLNWHFLRGYFDGDGSIGYSRVGNYKRWMFSLCGTENLLLGAVDLFGDKQINASIRQMRSIHSCYVRGNQQIARLATHLYRDSQNLRLDRKFNKFIELQSALPKDRVSD